MLNNAVRHSARRATFFKFNRTLLEFLIFINCLNVCEQQHLNPLEHGLCSDYLIGNLISTSVSTFKQLWLTSDKLSVLDRNKLTFVTYLDTWLRRDGSPNIDKELQTISCSDFGRKKLACKYDLEFSVVRHAVFDGIHLHVFLQNENNGEWRVIVIDTTTGSLVFYDTFKSCAKRKRRTVEFYMKFYCIIDHYLNLNDVKSLLMMNIDLRTNLEQSSFEVWCFFKNSTMKKLKFNDRDGNSQLINLSLNSYKGITLASVQFVTNEFVTLNQTSFNLFQKQEQNDASHSYHPHQHSQLSRIRRSDHRYDFKRYSRPNSVPQQLNKRPHRKHRKKKFRKHRKKGRNRLKVFDSDQVSNRKNSVIEKLKSIKAKAVNLFFPYKQNHVIVFHKYFATFHNVEENFFVQSARLPFVQPNQVFLGCPQPFCFLTTIDDLTVNHLTNELLLFRNQYYWTLPITNTKTTRQRPYIQFDYPTMLNAKLISNENPNDLHIRTESDFPSEFPMYIDAATFISFENFNYLVVIKEGWVYIYIPNNRRLVPLLFTDYFEGSMIFGRIDTLFFYGRQLFVFSEKHYWLFDLVTDLKLQFTTKGKMIGNLPSYLDASFTYRNRFYFFKQNFFYLNDAKGNSIINPQLVHGTFLTGCQMNRLPSEVDMSELFKAPSLINYYCVRCPGYSADGFKNDWNLNRTFATVPNDDLEDRADLDGGRIRVTDESPASLPVSIAISSTTTSKSEPLKPAQPGIIKLGDTSPATTKKAILNHDRTTLKLKTDAITADGKKATGEATGGKGRLVNTIDKIDEFALNTWSFFTHHFLFGFLLLSGLLFAIYLCQRGRDTFLPLNRNEAQLRRKGKSRRKEMIRRNRRWN